MSGVIRRGLAATLASVCVAAGAVVAVAVAGPAAGAAGDFYQPPAPLPAGRDGDVIRSEPVSYVDGGAQATRVMYLSRDIDGAPVPVTGTVLVPDEPWPGPGPRPIVAYGSATVGAGDECALSRTMAGEGRSDALAIQRGVFVNPLLERGFAVAQTDFQGSGTPGDPTFMARLPQARAMLDVLRAAQRLPGAGLADDGPVGITGYSQSGGASAAAAELAPDYAPELDLRGVYVGAAPTDITEVARKTDGGYAGGILSLALLGANAAYPELDVDGSLLNDRGRGILDSVRGLCTMEIGFRYPFLRTSSITADGRPLADHLTAGPFRRLADEQRIGTLTPDAPVLIEHPLTDDLVPYRLGTRLARDWCARGSTVEFRTLHTFPFVLSHVAATGDAAEHSGAWLADRFAGRTPRSTC
ncbi:lipase family protein [Streptomyces sp. DSM 44917]|uniref:Lipase family protein n=1 Tax=Streptomyces boetiae TaxID=3075541 RepID=A0ABU2L1J4_9ACTN|nr:lipase family protein [Streptomyces sp. DSM 44917]MDT0305400.1 lipase family protein [Streptomyces sp. DSM 44917]